MTGDLGYNGQMNPSLMAGAAPAIRHFLHGQFLFANHRYEVLELRDKLGDLCRIQQGSDLFLELRQMVDNDGPDDIV